jgi:hypothetical protein
MSVYQKLSTVLKRLNVPNPSLVSEKLLYDDYYEFENLFNKSTIGDSNIAETKKVKYKHNGKIFTFELAKIVDNEMIDYSILTKNGHFCVAIFIPHNSNEAHLHTLSYFPDCAEEGLSYPGGGTILLQFTIKFLKQNKSIRWIRLKDNSRKYCPGSPSIELSNMYFLLYGNTWYGKYHFRPYDPNDPKNSERLLDSYKQNQEIIRKTLVSNVPNLRKYIINAYNDIKPEHLNLDNLLYVHDTFKKKNKRLCRFFQSFLIYYDKTCSLFGNIYKDVCKDINLYDFQGKSFRLDLTDNKPAVPHYGLCA